MTYTRNAQSLHQASRRTPDRRSTALPRAAAGRGRTRTGAGASRLAVPLLPVLLAVLVLLPAAPAAGQAEGSTAGLPFIDRVDVDVVNVEVFVTDRQGRRVTDLDRDDFEIRVDGEPVEVTNFYLSRERRRPEEPGEIPAGTAAGGVQGPPPSGETTEPEPDSRRDLFFVVYVDNANLTPHNRKRVLDELREVVAERTAAGDPVMVVSYDRALEVLQPFTRDAQPLEEAFRHLEKQITRRQLTDANLRQTLRRIEEAPSLAGGELARYRQEVAQEAVGAYKALHDLVRGLAGLPGRKAVLYVSEGIPGKPGSELETIVFGPGPHLDVDLSRYHDRIAREANAHETTLYTLDARGSGDFFFTGAEARGFQDFGPRGPMEAARNLNLQEPLLDMALYTGGKAIINTGNFAGALDDMAEDFDSFYSLGFLSRSGGDGEYHDIEVRVKRPRLEVRHRTGYLDKPRVERVADRTTAFLLQQWESNPMGVRLGFGEPERRRRHWVVPLLVRIPAGALALVPRDDQSVGRVHLYVAVRDGEGGQSEVTRVLRDVAVPTEQLESARRTGGTAGDVGYALEVALRPGPSQLVVGVWDEVGGTESYVFQRLEVGKPD